MHGETTTTNAKLTAMETQTILATIAGVSSALVAADHILAKTESILQNSVGPFVWAFITNKPIRARKEDKMGFNFDTFLKNFGQVAAQGLQTYEEKQAKGVSLHQADYVAMAVPALFAVLSAFQSSTNPTTTETKTVGQTESSTDTQ